MEETGSESYSGDAWAEESLFPGGASPVTISNGDDELVSVSELFAKADRAPMTATATAIPAADTHKWQISEAVPRDERPNGPKTTPAAPPQQEASGVFQEAQAITPARAAGPGSLNGVIEVQLQSNYSADGA